MGGLGYLSFPQGWYLYTGSALGGLTGRIARHSKGVAESSRRWHVDYLSSVAQNKRFAVVLTGSRLECTLNRAVAGIPGAAVAAEGFGASDCRCRSHLHRLPRPVWPDYPGLVPWNPET